MGHYRPHLPGELGFYDLRAPETREPDLQFGRGYLEATLRALQGPAA